MNIENIPIANKIVETILIFLGFNSTCLPKQAAHIPKKKIIKVNPISVANLLIPNKVCKSIEYCEKL